MLFLIMYFQAANFINGSQMSTDGKEIPDRPRFNEGRSEKSGIKLVTVVCFDFWDTLVEGGGQPQINDLKRILGADKINSKKFLQEVEKCLLTHPWPLKKGIQYVAHALKLKTQPDIIEKAYQSWWSYVEKARPYPESQEVLLKLQKMKIKMIIVSNTDLEAFEFKIKKLRWQKYFDRCFLSANVGILKPDVTFFQTVKDYLGVPKKQIVMVDDSLYHGVCPVRAFGWQALWIARNKPGKDSGKITNLKEIFNYTTRK